MATPAPDSTSLRSQLMNSAAALREEREACVMRIAEIDRKLAAHAVLLDDEAASAAPGGGAASPEAPRPPETWREIFAIALAGVNGGKTNKEILATVPGTPMETKHAGNPNGFYNALTRLERGGQIVRANGRIYLPETLARIKSGEIEEERAEAEEPEGDGMPSIILRILREYPGGLNARGVMRVLRTMPEALPRLEKNPQLAYAALSRLTQGAIIQREGGVYRLPRGASADVGATSLFDNVERPEKLHG